MPSLHSKIRGRALGYLQRFTPSIEEISTAREVLRPAEDQETLPGICEPRDFERVTACEKTTTMDEERARMRGGLRHHGATVLYRLENARLHDGWVSCNGWRSCNSSGPAVWSGGPAVQMDNAAFASTFVGSMYFAHWLADDLSLLLEAELHGPAVSTARRLFSHEPGYMDLLGLHVSPLIRARFRHLTWIDNVAQNSYRARQYRELRRRVREATTPVSGRRVLLRRGRSGAERLLVNELAIETLLAARGFELVDPQQMGVREIAQACSGARIALSVEGSQLAHAFLAMADHAAIVAMVPPYRYINHYKDLTDCVGMRYGSLTGTAVQGGFQIDPDELLRLLDRVDTELAAGA